MTPVPPREELKMSHFFKSLIFFIFAGYVAKTKFFVKKGGFGCLFLTRVYCIFKKIINLPPIAISFIRKSKIGVLDTENNILRLPWSVISPFRSSTFSHRAGNPRKAFPCHDLGISFRNFLDLGNQFFTIFGLTNRNTSLPQSRLNFVEQVLC